MSEAMMDDPFATGTDAEDYDPFATADDVKSTGVFVPSPPLDSIAGRLVVMVPREHDDKAKVSEYLQREFGMDPFREEWKVDLIVLNGGTLEYEYRSKKKDSDDYEQKEMKVEELPFLVPNFRVSWGNIIGVLNKLAGTPKPFGLGRIMAGYSAQDMRRGKTFDQFTAERKAWETKAKANPAKAGNPPKPTWHFVVSEDETDRALAMKWWKEARAAGFKLN